MPKIESPFKNDLSFKSNSSPIVIINKEFFVVDVNKSALDLLGYHKNEILGKNIEKFTDSSNFEIDHNQIELLIKGRIPHYKAFRKYYDKSGKTINIELLVSVLKDSKTDKIYFSGVFNKLNFNKTKKLLNIEDRKINKVIEQSPVLQYILDIENDANIYENKSLISYLGYKLSDLGNYTEFDFLDTKIPKTHFHKFKSKINNFKRSKNPNDILEIEYPIKNKKDEIVWIYDKSVALKVKKSGKKLFSYGIIIDITERKKQKDKYERQQNFIAKISESIPSFIFMMKNESQEVSFSNKRAKQILGYSEKEFNDISREELVHPGFFVDYQKKLNIFLKSSKNKSFQTKLKLYHKTKGYRWFSLKVIAFERDTNKKPLNLLRIIEDIHDNELNLNKLKEQQNFIKNITSKLPATVYVVDIKTQKILYSNVSSKNIMGYTNSYWSLNIKELIHPEYFHKQVKTITDFIEQNNNKTLETEILLKHKTKGYRWFKTRLKIIKRDVNNAPLQILEIFDDIHEVKMKNIKISEQENLIKNITNSMSNFMYLCDIEKGIYTYTNFENRKIFGYTKEEYLGKSSQFVHQKFKAILNNFTKDVKNQVSQKTFEVELKIKHKSKGFIWVTYKVIVLNRFDNGSPSQILEIAENINESKEKALKISEQQNLIEKISSSIPDFIYLKNLKTSEIVFSNKKAKEVLGYNDDAFISTIYKKFVNKNQINKVNEYNKKVKKSINQNVFQFELIITHKTKGPRWFKNTTIVFERNSKNEPITVLEMITDINNQKLNEEQILDQQKFIENISSTIPQYLSVYDLGTKECLYTNFEDKLIFGYTSKEYLSHGSSLIHPDYKEKTTYLVEKLVNSQKSNLNNSIEFLIKHKTRGYIWAKLNILTTTRNKEGVAIQALEIIENIDKTKKSFNKILEQQNFIQKVASTIPNIIQVLNVKTFELIYSNFERRTFLGYKKHEWDKLKLDTIHEKHYKYYIGRIQDLIHTKNNTIIKDEILVKDKSGNYKWVLVINSVFKINENEVEQIMTVFSDINETKTLQLLLEKQLSKNLELERFASITSHDLKEPLRTLGNYAQILQSGYYNIINEEAKELIDHISKSSKRMNELINDILDFSKVQTGGKKFEQIDLNELIKIVLEDLKDLISESKTDLNIGNLPEIEGDRTQLRQVFQNLISNAIKFTKGTTPVIKIKTELVDDKHVVSVEDNGIGIKESDQKNIFRIFKKLHRQNEFEGQGIGLSICKRIIERHDGEIWLYSKKGEGTTFYFSLPVKVS